MLSVMRRRYRAYLRDPKHVRDYFHKYALFTRLFHLCADGIWWLVSTGFLWFIRRLTRTITLPLWNSLRINETQRQYHSFIVGRTGVGKSVLIHHLIRHYLVRNTKPSVVLFDPHGDLARSIAQDRALKNNGRLVYIDPNGIARAQVHFNPFDLAKRDEHTLSRAQTQFAGALEQIVGQSFSPIQRSLIRACLGVVLHRPNSSLLDLLRLLQEDNHADLLRYGQEALPNPIDRQFFRGSFGKTHYQATKQALVARLNDILRDLHVRRFACQKSSLDLTEQLDSGKIIVVRFDPSKQSTDAIRTIGQLLSAAIFSYVLGRSLHKRHPIHFFVDECQYFVSPTIADILGESRKFGLFATLATQRIEKLDPDLQDAILGNVGTLWVGASRDNTAAKIAKETDLKPEDIRALPNLHFYHIEGDKPAKRQRLKFLGKRFAMKPKDWAQIKREQVNRYYRDPKKRVEAQPNNQKSWTPLFL